MAENKKTEEKPDDMPPQPVLPQQKNPIEEIRNILNQHAGMINNMKTTINLMAVDVKTNKSLMEILKSTIELIEKEFEFEMKSKKF
ncbi:hypothetical protein LCGC14_2227860 [marine sediment metagenome]|uniref:Uncharacterized protein n=1 Tax=marine sediment metagenome TaxID=412755 RepID=A0A0F9FLL8_9ZZZZ